MRVPLEKLELVIVVGYTDIRIRARTEKQVHNLNIVKSTTGHEDGRDAVHLGIDINTRRLQNLLNESRTLTIHCPNKSLMNRVDVICV